MRLRGLLFPICGPVGTRRHHAAPASINGQTTYLAQDRVGYTDAHGQEWSRLLVPDCNAWLSPPILLCLHRPAFAHCAWHRDRLLQRSVAPARKDVDQDFPLRGFLTCQACGCWMTACWSQSRTGRKYPYYLCQNRKCSERGQSTPKDVVEDAFDQLLESAVPAKATFELAEKMFRAAWDRKAEQTTEDQQALRTRAKSIERDVEVYLERNRPA